MRAASRIAIIESSVGGLLPGRAYLVHGAPGVGKTVLALQIAHAWTAVGRHVLYLTSEPPEHLLQQASLLGLSLQKDWEEERFLLCPFVAEVSEQIGALGLAAFLERLRRMDAEHHIGAIIIDPVFSLLRAYGRGAEIRRNVETLMSSLEEWEWSALLLGRTDSLQRRAGLLEALRERAWGALELSHARHGCAAGPFLLKVERARQGVAHAAVPYTITIETGLMPVGAEAHDRSSATPDAPRDPWHAAASPERKRVLIACTESESISQLVRILERRMQVEVVGEGSEALSRAAAWRPDVIAVQQDLPGLAGLSLVRALRRARYTMPAIMLSLGGRRRSDRVRALLHGATDFIECPFDPAELAARIQTASLLRLTAPPVATDEETWLSALAARSRELQPAEFLETLDVALRCTRHFSSPVSLVAFGLAPGVPPVQELQARSIFRDLLLRETREGDLLCFPEGGQAVLLLCDEHEEGALILAERLRRALEEELQAGSMIPAWRIGMACRTFSAEAELHSPPRLLLERLLAAAASLYASADQPGHEATGTDGR